MKMLEIILSVLLGISVLGNIVLIRGVKIEVQQTQTQTTVNDVKNQNINENINSVTVGSSTTAITNKSVISKNSCVTNSTTNITGSTNFIFK